MRFELGQHPLDPGTGPDDDIVIHEAHIVPGHQIERLVAARHGPEIGLIEHELYGQAALPRIPLELSQQSRRIVSRSIVHHNNLERPVLQLQNALEAVPGVL